MPGLQGCLSEISLAHHLANMRVAALLMGTRKTRARGARAEAPRCTGRSRARAGRVLQSHGSAAESTGQESMGQYLVGKGQGAGQGKEGSSGQK